jgi:dihydrofolate synthase/folylpolyglutamate synthase
MGKSVPMSFREATNYLQATINETASRRNPGRLDRMASLLRHLQNPHLAYPTVHVGGTSGKGSTCTMIAASLSTSGKRVGLHTKPHLSSMTERARIDGVPISTERFGELLSQMMPAIEAAAREFGRPSYYETLLALALLHFAHEGVDVAVVEVGIGGTLDGTNLLRPEVSVITNVGLDHTDVLGDTPELIARDKAGIAKAGVPLVSDATGAALHVIEVACARVGAPFLRVDAEARIEQRPSEPYGQSFAVVTARGTYELALPVLGRFQQRNAATAIVALERLRPQLRPSIGDVERGLAQLMLPARMEFFPGFPGIIFDIAHNPDKAANLALALDETFPGRRFSFVVGIGESKDAVGILRPLLALPGSFIFTSFETPGRVASKPARLVNIAQSAGTGARAISDPVEALSVARRNADASHIVVVTGSTFVTAKLRDWWLDNVVERSRN